MKNEILSTLIEKRHQLLVAACVCLGQFLYGFGLGWSAPVIPMLQDPEQTPLDDVLSDAMTSWVASAIYIGQIIGPLLIVYLSNSRGRKPCMLISAAFSVIAYILLASATNFFTIIIGRVFSGVGLGISCVLNTVYLGEMATTNIRGILLTSTGVFLTTGTLVAYATGPFMPYYGISCVGLGVAVVHALGLLFIVPESPIFYAMKGRDKDTVAVLEKLNRREDINLILTIDKKEQENTKWTELFTIKSNRRAFFITMPLSVLEQLSGVIVVIFYATTIFELANSSVEPHIATILIGLTQFIASLICPFVVENGGRKMLMLISSSICFFSLAALGAFFYMSDIDHPATDSILWLPLVSLIIYFLGFDTGFGVIPITLTGEMYLPNMRSIGSLISNLIAYAFGFALSSVFSYMINDFGAHWTFWMFAFVCAVAFVFTLLVVPETKGKSLFEIQEMLNK